MTKKHIYFPGLNALRFYAALSVIFSHIRFRKQLLGISLEGDWHSVLQIFFPSGGDSVLLFFVLSGFLITYLLLAEYDQEGKINVQSFYMRRILRIWPLYYLIVLIGFLLVPLLIGFDTAVLSPANADYWPKLVLHLLILPNFSGALRFNAGQIGHLWSIGVEEQFYLMWPLLIRRFIHRISYLLVGIVGFKVVVWLVVTLLSHSVDTPAQLPPVWLPVYFIGEMLLNQFQIESMAIGGIGAYLVFYKREQILRVLYSSSVQIAVAVLMVAHILFFDTHDAGQGMLISILYVVFVLNIASNPHPFIRFDNKILHYLGKISYGIYMYHLPILYLILVWSVNGGLMASPLLFNGVTYPSIVLLTIGAAVLSYHFFEQPFLRLKERFTVVPSGQPKTVS